MSYFNVENIRRAVTAAGSHFFDRATMRFFGSRVLSGAVCGPASGLYYFVTSERGARSTDPRRYTVRSFDPSEPSSVSTLGEFREHASPRAARAAARKAP